MSSSSFVIVRESPDRDDVRALIAALDRELEALYPPESNHLLDVSALMAPDIVFLVARACHGTPHVARRAGPISSTETGGAALGCAALVPQEADGERYGEVKRVYVAPHARGQGIARGLLMALIEEGQARGLGLLRLETGIRQPAAIALFRSLGFRERGPFGAYRPDPNSVFLERAP